MLNQRWEEGQPRWRPSGELIRTSEYEISEMPGKYPVAAAFIKTHHYSGSVPSGRFSFGLHTHGRLVGVAMFSHPTNNKTLTNVFPCQALEAIELGRFVLLDEVPGNGETWFLARCFDGLKRRGIRGVVSFSDPMPRRSASGDLVLPGHVGTIYQAHNAVYLGRGTARTLRLMPDGTVFNDRTTQKIRARERGWESAVQTLQGYGAGALDVAPSEWLRRWMPLVSRPLRHLGNHRYAWALDRRLRRDLPAGAPAPKQLDPEAA
jgi:hypothetical protein